jgi:hypothetical protein
MFCVRGHDVVRFVADFARVEPYRKRQLPTPPDKRELENTLKIDGLQI